MAQHIPLAEVLPDLVLREIVLDSTPLPPGSPGSLPGGATHTAHFSPLNNDPTNPAIAIVEAFNTQIATQFSSFPLGSSTGGLTYVFDESVGTFRRSSASFGPLFGERATTIGRRRLSAGFNYQRTSYNTFEGLNLQDRSIKFYLRHQDCCGFADPTNLTGFALQPDGTRLDPPFEGDLIEAGLSLKATTQTTALFLNYGLTSRWDLGLAVPFVRVKLDASVLARILRLVTATAPDTHTFQLGHPEATETVQHSGQATGLGDVVVRTKYHFFRGAGGGVAATVDIRLPTGDENELLGAGGTEAKILLVASSERGPFGHHVNIGYTVAHGAVAGTPASLTAAPIPDELNYSAGSEFVASPRLTLMGDILGRTLRGVGRLDLVSKRFEYNDPGPLLAGTPGPGCAGFVGLTCSSISLTEFAPRAGNLTLLLGTVGAKYNFAGNLLLSGSVLVPFTKTGLRSRLTTTVGIDYAF
jgi:hypothetical protein